MRKLMLPLAVCAAFGVTAAPSFGASANVNQNKKIGKLNGALKGVQKAITILQDADKGQIDSINKAHGKADENAAGLKALDASVKAITAAATSALTQLQAGLTTLAAAVQGPNVAGQLGAAGSALPGAANAATPSALPTGTVYRQVVLATAPGNPADGAPLGIRMWVKMPEVTTGGLYSNNEWVCVSHKGTAKVGGGVLDGQVACPAGTAT